jgi:hypothetical protein
VKLFYCHKAEDVEDIKKMRELAYMKIEGKITQEEFDRELKKIKDRQLNLYENNEGD